MSVKTCPPDILVVDGPALVAVTRPAAVPVIGQAPVLRLQGEEQTVKHDAS